METKLLVKDSDNELIHELSKALLDCGITEGADCYYISDNYGVPFFKLPKAYKKENENDPDFHHVFIDVEEKSGSPTNKEFSVYGTYHHEHYMNASDAAENAKKLLSGEICEVVLTLGCKQASLFMINCGDPEKNVNELMSDFENIHKHLTEGKVGGYHIHLIYQKTFPNNLLLQFNAKKDLQNYNAYATCSVLAEHPEFYIFG